MQIKSIITKFVWMLCRDAAYFLQNNANREQNHQTCLGVMPRCCLFSAKIHNLLKIKTANSDKMTIFAKFFSGKRRYAVSQYLGLTGFDSGQKWYVSMRSDDC